MSTVPAGCAGIDAAASVVGPYLAMVCSEQPAMARTPIASAVTARRRVIREAFRWLVPSGLRRLCLLAIPLFLVSRGTRGCVGGWGVGGVGVPGWGWRKRPRGGG